MRDSTSTFLTIALAFSPSSKARLIYEGLTHCIVERLYLPHSDQPFHYLLTMCNDESNPEEPVIFTNYQGLLQALDLATKKWREKQEDIGIHLGPYWATIGLHA
ncbi:MAG: hypothetical protein JO202_15535 [Ktedonobacteraceae bacterium]|nr:hypothetical protein [Ktedonobacteraceae bacterium]